MLSCCVQRGASAAIAGAHLKARAVGRTGAPAARKQYAVEGERELRWRTWHGPADCSLALLSPPYVRVLLLFLLLLVAYSLQPLLIDRLIQLAAVAGDQRMIAAKQVEDL